MPVSTSLFNCLLRFLALLAFLLSACSGPAAAPTATAVPATATGAPTAAPQSTATISVEERQPILATDAKLEYPLDIAFDANGNLYISDCGVSQVLIVDQTGLLTVYAGTGTSGFSGDGGPAVEAQLDCPGGLAVDRDGNLFIVDYHNYRVRRVDRNGIISTAARTGLADFGAQGGPTAGALLGASDVGLDAAGNLYIDDAMIDQVRRVDPGGLITTIAGNGAIGFSGDGGPAVDAQLNSTPSENHLPGIVVGADGTVYFSDVGNSRVRRIDLQGIITTVAGTGQPGYSGDGGPGAAARLGWPTDLALDAAGNLFISDNPGGGEDGNRVRRVDRNGIITTVAGVDTRGPAVDGGPATATTLNHPRGLAIDPEGNLYIVDGENQRVRKVDQNGIITTVAGGGD
jgi:sugar lactone lactonase YvrE